ncbi:Rim9p TDEL_0B07240 [Torulaspora delbrueckii]|uniref:PH-response regulator protein palI/RIM9 n=1 Tax=Torulaspora delbrueckii TaxID=4950 RepID=G8ZQF9_TORDE|nr:hypothetical protein TDEL_0B07240 [Torulaspora delbrueckii]CCE90853.1 hypothetical protein TDEL_0B07240 [Torulaspora delbrueckii]
MSQLIVVSAILLFITVALVFQLLPIVAVPISKELALATFYNSTYGVFGWCYITANDTVCTPKRIGYVDLSVDLSGQRRVLPAFMDYSVTRLLVVHPLSFAITSLLWIMVLLILITSLGDSPRYLFVVALFSLPTFLFSLLCFLVDILIFISHLAWPGWLMLGATLCVATCCSLLWNLRRSVSIKKYEALHSEERVEVPTYSMVHYTSNG